MSPFDITKKYQMKYNTIRSIVNNFKTSHRINIKKKVSGYSKKKRVIAAASRHGMVDDIGLTRPLDADAAKYMLGTPDSKDIKKTKKAKRKPVHVCEFVIAGP
jgi:hypothetical protein